ncbi:MAG: transporter, partial [Zavarzinia sp.]|nr:transporter [Zavarzinia sp.]
VALPPLMNEFINILKVTSLAYVISLREIMAVVNDAIATSFRFVEWYCAALVYYLVIVSILMLAQAAVEKRLTR